MHLPEVIDLRCLSFRDHSIRRQLANHELIRLTPEIAVDRKSYQALKPWDKKFLQSKAVGMSASTAVLTGKAAARLHGLDVRGFTEDIPLAYPSGKPPPRKDRHGGIIYLNSPIGDDEFSVIDGVRVANIPRLLRDIAYLDGLVDTVVTIDSILRQYPTVNQALLRNRCTDNQRFRGITVLRKAIDLSSALSESPLESETRVHLVLGDVGTVREQAEIDGKRVDFLIAEGTKEEVILEVDGEIKYDGVTYNKKATDVVLSERRREKELQNDGHMVLRISAKHLANEGAEMLRIVRQAQRRQSA